MSDLKIFTDNIEPEALNQIYTLVKQPAFSNCKVRIMPDVHAGAGCVIGFTADLGDKVIPNIVGVDIGCLDKDTEYLTPLGWKKMNEYDGEAVLGFNPTTNEADFVKPLAYIVKPCKQFFHYKNKKGLDQMVSEEHKMLVYSGYKAHGYKKTDMSPSELNSKSLEKGYYNFETVFKRKSGSLLMTDNQIRLAIMIAADGRVRKVANKQHLELHLGKERKIQRAQELLKLENIPYSITVIQDDSTMIYATIDEIYDKDLTFLYKGNSAQLKVAAEESLKWDGHEGYRSFYSTNNKKNADAIQYAFHGSGIRAGIGITNYEGRGWKNIYVVTPTQNSKVGYNKQPTLEPAVDGQKYCFTMPQGYFVARRNGKIFLTGNCGMLVVSLGKTDINFKALDNAIRKRVPSGRNVHDESQAEFDELKSLYCYKNLKDIGRIERSIGTLGGGNHFIEVDTDDNGVKYLVIHSGSRNLGKQVAEYYQSIAVETMQGKDQLNEMQDHLISEYKASGRSKEIQKAIKEMKQKFSPNPLGIPKELCYLTGENREKYLHDMRICQHFAVENRKQIAEAILDEMRMVSLSRFETIHNYIEFGTNMVRKGAISARAGQRLLIPINMRDGCIIGIGKGNADWNCSAPHGAGRLMSRSKAKEVISLDEFEKSMDGIYTTSVCQSTIDESPMAYKSIDEIVNNISDTVEIEKIIKPIYNFKASE